ncbi:MAG: 5-carboxymethyl-2-hydroxymuconate Delta-isomerase [Firmicutes bacterium]|nr:5-carboxymethyl-2-hydroxymuconate Delta-isomerase [Bacillota bacterium]
MKIVRFEADNTINYGILAANEQIHVVKGDIFNNTFTETGEILPLNNVKLLSPCVPSKAVCIGLNYHDHAREMKLTLPEEPLIFLKPSSALNHPNGTVEYPAISKNLHYEGELAIVIKKEARKVPIETAENYVLGYTCANDVTARDIQMKDGQWTRGKSFDTFLPLGPCIETELDPHNVSIRLLLNGEVKQSSNTSNLIFKVAEMVSFVSQVMTLYPGDVILTGTPSGVGPMQVGDFVTVDIEGIGALNNTIVGEKER